MLTEEDKKFILNLARQAIAYFFEAGKILKVKGDDVPENLRAKFSCFATLTINGDLRGCIGHTEPTQPLYKDIVENAVGAAFQDFRFSSLTKDEFENIEIEVSVLTPPQKLDFNGPDDLLNKLRPNIDGVIIQLGRRGATYLPQVWEELPDKKEFLSSLCQKAGLAPNDWQNPGLKVSVYQAEVIK